MSMTQLPNNYLEPTFSKIEVGESNSLPMEIKAFESNMNPAARELKLVFATLTYGPVDPRHAKLLRVAIMHAGQNGVTWLGDVSPDRTAWAAARNIAAKAGLEADADGIVWCDSDMIIPANGITRLVSYDRDFVSGVYFQRKPPHHPLIATFDPVLDSFRWMTRWPQNVFFPADGIGFGFCYTSTRLLRQMLDEIPEVKKHGWFDDKYSKFSEDLTFCRNARKVGCSPYVDTGLLLGHLGDAEEITVETFKKLNPYSEGTADPLVMPSGVNIND